jgi:hypothetical protein
VSLYPSNENLADRLRREMGDERFEEMATILRLAQARSEADAERNP